VNPTRRVHKSRHGLPVSLLLFAIGMLANGQSVLARTATPVVQESKSVRIAKITRPPNFEALLPMDGVEPEALGMTKVERFTQTDPDDGKPATQRTVAYLGYDAKSIYVVYLAFDNNPGAIRSHMVRREQIDQDDQVGVVFDSFHDKRRGYAFFLNGYGVQQDAIWTEENGFDIAWDTVWNSRAKITDKGWVAVFEFPFRSLRFSNAKVQDWGIWLQRDTPRKNESDTWPEISRKVSGRLSQEGTLTGFENISPGRNMQFVPYTLFTSNRVLDARNEDIPFFTSKPAKLDAGLDSKFILKDKLVLDLTVNPDFSQVESDQPQTTTNQRFEVFFPEKRPFFQENANFFSTPVDLYFTRRIIDPQFGLRLTGKLAEKTDIGLLLSDDQSVGKAVDNFDPSYNKRAYFGIVRLNQNFGNQNSFGFIFADREFKGTTVDCELPTEPLCQTRYNRAGGIDFRYRIHKNWIALGGAVHASTWLQDGTHLEGNGIRLRLETRARTYDFNTEYNDNTEGFRNRTGSFRRPDVRRTSTYYDYKFWHNGKFLIWHGPEFFMNDAWSHDGANLETEYNTDYRFMVARSTDFGVWAQTGSSTLRPSDFDTLPTDRRYPFWHQEFFADTQVFSWLTLGINFGHGTDINFEPASVLQPQRATTHYNTINMTLRPMPKLTIDNTYLRTHLQDIHTGVTLFDDHIIRTKWNYQVNRELSFRTILQYNATLPNQGLTDLDIKKGLNADFLVTYLIHPGTALYVGYNSDYQNYDLQDIEHHNPLERVRRPLINDGKQFFVKLSYLFRF
jgi:hypothetical protein